MEESQHAKLDTLVVDALVEGRSEAGGGQRRAGDEASRLVAGTLRIAAESGNAILLPGVE